MEYSKLAGFKYGKNNEEKEILHLGYWLIHIRSVVFFMQMVLRQV